MKTHKLTVQFGTVKVPYHTLLVAVEVSPSQIVDGHDEMTTATEMARSKILPGLVVNVADWTWESTTQVL